MITQIQKEDYTDGDERSIYDESADRRAHSA